MNSHHLLAAILVLSFPSVAGADPVRSERDGDVATKFSVEVAGTVVSSIISVDGLEHSHATVESKDPEDDQNTRNRPNGRTKRIDIIRRWLPTSIVPWPHTDDGTLTPSAVSVVAEKIGADGAPIDTTFNFTGCLPTAQEFGWMFDAMGVPYVVEGDRIECQAVTIIPPGNTAHR